MKNLLKLGVIAVFSGVMSLQAAEFESNRSSFKRLRLERNVSNSEEPAISGGF